MMRAAELSSWLGVGDELATAQLRVAEAPIASAAGELDPLEFDGIAGASPTRLLEFTAGRCLARELLRGMGAPRPIVLRARDRSPVWPLGFVGSIAHTDSTCLVVVGRSPLVESVGVDVEPAESLEEDLFAEIATARELRWLATVDADRRGRFARRLFAAKEAVYKCLYPIDQEFLGFHDVELEFTEIAPSREAVVDEAAERIADGAVPTQRPSRPRLASFRVRCDVSPSGSDARVVGWTLEGGGLIRAFACLPAPVVGAR